MKRLIFSVLSLVTCVTSWSQAHLEVQKFYALPGACKKVSLCLVSQGEEYCTFMCDIRVPEGVEIPRNEDGEYQLCVHGRKEASDAVPYHVTSHDTQDGCVRLLCYSFTNVSFPTADGGAVIDIPLQVSPSLQYGDYDIEVLNAQIVHDGDSVSSMNVQYRSTAFDVTDQLKPDEAFLNEAVFLTRAVSYTRDFPDSNNRSDFSGWQTIVLPFDVETIEDEDGRLLAPYGSPDAALDMYHPFWLAELTHDGFEMATCIKANKPYIIAMPSCQDSQSQTAIDGKVTFAAKDARIQVTTDTMSATGASYYFVPTYSYVASSTDVYAINTDFYIAEYGKVLWPGTAFVSNLRNVQPFEGYLSVNGTSPHPKYIPIESTDIEDGTMHLVASSLADGSMYDLMGRKILPHQMQKGNTYIVHGVKMRYK